MPPKYEKLRSIVPRMTATGIVSRLPTLKQFETLMALITFFDLYWISPSRRVLCMLHKEMYWYSLAYSSLFDRINGLMRKGYVMLYEWKLYPTYNWIAKLKIETSKDWTLNIIKDYNKKIKNNEYVTRVNSEWQRFDW